MLTHLTVGQLRRNESVALAGLCLWVATGCDDLSEFRTGEDEVFRDVVVGSESDPTAGSFIRQGFVSFTELELTFDPALASRQSDGGTPASPGTIHTSYPCPGGDAGCERGERVEGPFVHAALEPISKLSSDALSQYDFPGGGRIRNYIFGARFESGSGEEVLPRHAMVFLSLMENGKIELRVVAPGARGPGDSEDRYPPLFGVFRLEREQR